MERRSISSNTSIKQTLLSLDLRRSLSVCIFSLAYGFFGYYWYIWLDKKAKASKFQKYISEHWYKVFFEQFTWNPLSLIAYFVSVSLMEGKSTNDIADKLYYDLPPTLTS